MIRLIIEKINTHWRTGDLEELAEFLDENIEIRSTNLFKMYPDSKGVLIGKDEVFEYMRQVRIRIPEFVFDDIKVEENGNKAILESKTDEGVIAHIQYFMNDNGLIYLIKSDVVRVNY